MKKIILLALIVASTIITGCSKEDDRPKYPESLMTTAWESKQLVLPAGTGIMRMEFVSNQTMRFLMAVAGGSIIFDGNYRYSDGKGQCSLSNFNKMVLTDGNEVNSSTISAMKKILQQQGNYTVYNQLVDMEKGINMIMIDFQNQVFTVKDNILDFDGIELYRK